MPDRDTLPPFLDRYAVAHMLGMSPNWVGSWRRDPSKPRHVVAGRRAWYRRDEVLAWVRSQEGKDTDHSLASSQRQGALMREHTPSDAELERKFQEEWGDDNETPPALRLVPAPDTIHHDEVDEQADFSFVSADKHATVAEAIAALDDHQLRLIEAVLVGLKAASR